MPDSPYTDLDRPPLNAAALRRALVRPGGLWTQLEVRAETGSTNADAGSAARAGALEGLVIVAERQTAGRGRLGRAWSSPPRAGLAVSVLLRPGEERPSRGWAPVAPARFGWLPLLVGVALTGCVTRQAEVDAALKWPNDLLVRGPARANGGPSDYGKCAGVLAESLPEQAGRPPAVVVGVGLNVTLRADELPERADGPPATSLRLAGVSATDRDSLLRGLLRGIEDWYGRWRSTGGDPEACDLRTAYTRSCATIGEQVRVLLPGGATMTGRGESVDLDGRLILRTADGPVPVAAGDVLHVRD